jgi:diguanylate cyclase (GGDEF)-like protein/PAS domain S-box-containing protein
LLVAHRRDTILEAVAACASELLHAADVCEALPKVVERLGHATGVDRVHIFEMSTGAAAVDGSIAWHFVWSAPGIDKTLQFAERLPMSMLDAGTGSWIAKLSRGETIIGHGKDFEAPAREMLAIGNVKSVLAVPVFADDRWWGIIGFDDCQSEREWLPTEIATLKMLGELVGAAVARSRHLDKLADATRIIETSPTILYRLGPQPPYPMLFVSHNIQRYGYAAEDLLASPTRWAESIADDDRPAIMADIKSIIDGKTGHAPIEFRSKRRDGTYAWFEGHGSAVRDDAGQVTAVEGMLTDITKRKHSEERVQLANALLAAQLDCSPDGVLVVDGNARIVSVNRPFVEMWRIPKDLVTRFDGPVLPEANLDAPVLAIVTSRMKDPAGFAARVRYLMEHRYEASRDELETADGRFIDRHTRALHDPAGGYLGRVWFFRDVTDWKEAQRALRESEEKFRTIFGSSSDGILIFDLETGGFSDVNPAACSMFGYSREEIIGQDSSIFSSGIPPYTRGTALKWVSKVQSRGPQTFEWQCKTKDGHLFWSELSVHCASFGAQKNVVLAALRNITERKQIQAKIFKMARYDELTGLANRATFLERLNLALARARRGAAPFGILSLDLDHFKDVNDTLGHPVGDALLRAVADRLTDCVRETDLVARFGGDEFAVLQEDLTDIGSAEVLATKIRDALAVPYSLEGNQVRTTASIGIVPYGDGIDGAEAMMMKADLALYRAKDAGRNQYRFHVAVLDEQVRERVTVTEDLRLAIERNELVLLFQPEMELASGRIVGLEAVIRWDHPTRGHLLPASFIPIAETTGRILDIGEWMIDRTCRQISQWNDQGIAPASVAVNLSAAQFRLASALDRTVAESLARYRVAPDQLELELTESVLMETTQRHTDTFERLRRLGVRLAIDDFGTGYSSFDYLRSFHVLRLKIDRRFVEGVTETPDDAKIVRAIIALAHELDIEVVAKGVQSAEQRQFLMSAGCRLAQGNYLSEALPVERVTALLRKNAAPLAS